MRLTTLIFASLLLALTAIGGCRTNLGVGVIPLLRLDQGFNVAEATLSADEDETELWNPAFAGLVEANVDSGMNGGGGPQFAKLPLRRIVRPCDLPEPVFGWLPPEKRGTKSLQCFMLSTSRRGPPAPAHA